MRIGIVVAEFNPDATLPMLEVAKGHIDFLGGEVGPVAMVAGVFDTALALKALLRRDDIDAAIILGAVVEGETGHDEIVAGHAARKAIDLSLEHDKPVGLGITGPAMSRLQAHARITAAKHAVEAVVKSQLAHDAINSGS